MVLGMPPNTIPKRSTRDPYQESKNATNPMPSAPQNSWHGKSALRKRRLAPFSDADDTRVVNTRWRMNDSTADQEVALRRQGRRYPHGALGKNAHPAGVIGAGEQCRTGGCCQPFVDGLAGALPVTVVVDEKYPIG